jgi:TolB protein
MKSMRIPGFAFAISLSLAALLAFSSNALLAQKPPPIGMFTGSTDVGETLRGKTVFHAGKGKAGDEYAVTGGGADMWGDADAFHFSWLKFPGDAVFTADVQFPAGVNVPLEKAVLMFRDNLDPGAAYADIAVHADGHTTIQFRATEGEKTEDTVLTHAAPVTAPIRLRIERKGDVFTTWAGPADQPLTATSTTTVVLEDAATPVYVGIGVCAHDAEAVATVTFSNVKIERKPNP